MSDGIVKNQLEEKRKDADELIADVLKKVPDEKKPEILRIIEGFALCAQNNETDKKAG